MDDLTKTLKKLQAISDEIDRNINKWNDLADELRDAVFDLAYELAPEDEAIAEEIKPEFDINVVMQKVVGGIATVEKMIRNGLLDDLKSKKP